MSDGTTIGYKMNFSDKCKVLGELWLYYREDAQSNVDWDMFFQYNDIALPMAWGINNGLVSMVEDSGLEEYIDETWEMFCDYISIDPEGKYDGIAAAWNASPNAPLSESQKVMDEVADNVEVTVKRTRKKAPKDASPSE